ncbi:hypothetical protein Golob_000989, partial [Gossypium lobatum]|nr:hypothetical protein [Gossypium lobatum]
MAVDPDPQLTISWKDKLLGGHTVVSDSDYSVLSAKSDNDFELLEGDVNTTIIDGVPAITLSDHIKDFLFREMELTIIVKLLGRKSAVDDYNRVLTQGHWIVYGQYLTVIVDGAVQRVEYEALLTVCFACGKYGHVKEMCPSVVTNKNLMVNRDELSIGVALPNECNMDDETTGSRSREKEPEFRPWILVERKSSWRVKWDISGESLAKQTKNPLGSRFLALMVEKDLSDDMGLSAGEIVGKKLSARDSGSRSNRNTSFALRGRGNHFKPSANTSIPLVKSMEAMVELLSPQILNKNLNTELDGSCANVKFPRIFREYNMEYKPDIVSLLEQRDGKIPFTLRWSVAIRNSFSLR